MDTDAKLYAYKMSDRERDGDRDFNTLSAAGNRSPYGLWSDGTTMWVADFSDDKVYSYNMPPPSADARLSGLTVSPRDITGFTADRTAYEVGVASTVARATITATASNASAVVAYSGTDAATADGHQVNLSAGRNVVTITVTAEDSVTTQEYTVSVNQGVTDVYGWKAVDDLDGLKAAGNANPRSIWSYGATMWVSDVTDGKIFAYNTDGTRDETRDFDTLDAAGNNNPIGIWSNSETMWVADTVDDKIYAYKMSDQDRDSDKDFDTLDAAGNNAPRDIWSDGDTMWVTDLADHKLYAYKMSDRDHDGDKDFDTLAAGNTDPYGIWSDGETMWVGDYTGDKLYAYRVSDQSRDGDRDLNTLDAAGNQDPRGIWSDGETMWVADIDDDKVYSYNMPAPPPSSDDATLSGLTVSPRDIIGFKAERRAYEVGVASDVAQATITATASNSGAAVVYSDTDADANTDGPVGWPERGDHQVALSAGRNELTITVTATDTTTTKTYRVSVNRGVTDVYGWKAVVDLDGLKAAGNNDPISIWSDGATVWVADENDDKIYAYNTDGTRYSDKDFNTLSVAGNNDPVGIWSDGTTMWVTDHVGWKIYAYKMLDQDRDSGKDFDTLEAAGNRNPFGIWSDGTTMWVADSIDNKIYAYKMFDKSHDDDKDFDTLAAGNSDPIGIWSDGTTMWVGDITADKIFAYERSDKDRDGGRDFNTLIAAGNRNPFGIWSDGTTMWVADTTDDKVYSYNMPPSADATEARLRSLTLSRVTLAETFDRDDFDYAGSAPSGTTETTVTPVTIDPGATAVIKVNGAVDADGTVELASGSNGVPDEITVEVTAADGMTMRTYTVTVTVTGYLRPTLCGRGELPADTSTSALIVVPEIIRHGAGRCYSEIDAPGDVDWISVHLKRGRKYQIDMLGAGNAWTEVEGGDPLTLRYPRIRGIYHEDDLDRLWAPTPRIYATESADKFLYSMVPVAASGSVEAYIPPESGTFYIEVYEEWGEMTGTYAVQVFDLSAPIENAPPDWPKASVSEQSGGDLPADWTTTGFLGRGDATGRRTSGDTDWFEMELNPRTRSADVIITTSEPVTGAMKLRSYSGQTIVSEIGNDDEFHLSLRDYGGTTVLVEVGVFGYQDQEFDYTLTMLPMSLPQQVDAPAQPQGLTGTVAHDAVSLTWDDPGDAGITGYQILRRNRDVDAQGQFRVHVDDTGSAATFYVDRDVAPETRYGYRIMARSAGGLSERSDYFNADTPAAPDPALNRPATGAPTISGTAQVGETLTADTSGIGDADGLVNATFSYQWSITLGAASADIPGATEATYIPKATDEGLAIKVRVSFTDDAGNEETLTSAATEAVSFAVRQQAANSAATGAPTISGTARVGETLTMDTTGIADADGLSGAAFGYQWIANDGSADADISGATDSSYALAASDEARTIRVRVSFTDDGGNDESLTSAATASVAAAEPQEPPAQPRNLEAAVSDDGAVTLTWDDPGDAGITGYQILRRNRDTSAIGVFEVHVEDTGSAATSYVDRDAAPETRYNYRVRARNESGLSLRSNFVRADTPSAPNSPATGAPAISGTAQVGETLTADTSGIGDADGLTNVSYSYQWISSDGITDTEITGAMDSNYTLAADDEDATIRVRVSFTDDAGNEETLTSAATAAVAAKPNSPATGAPTISGTSQVGETLTADTSGIEDEDGLDDVVFSHQWRAAAADIPGATNSTYILTDADEGKAVTVRVSFTDDAGHEETLTSAATVVVEAESESQEPPARPQGLTGTAAHDEVSLTWNDPGDDGITGYQILRRNRDVDAPGQFQVHVDDTGSADATYIDGEVEADTRYVYRIKAINEAGLSPQSDYFRADTPPAPNRPATGAPTISGTARVGETLRADTSGIADADGLSGATFSYQWVATDGGRDLDIQGATEATYTLIPIDASLRFKVRVSFTDDGGNEETLTSAETAAVAKQ